jgi:hypothetical protein
MSLTEDIQSIKETLEKQEVEKKLILEEETKKKKKKLFKLPGKVKSKSKKALKAGKTLAVILKNNKTIDFQWVENFGGLVQYGPYEFSMYEVGAVYNYNNKLPCIVIPEWRLTPVGGMVEDAEREGNIVIPQKLFGGEADILISQALKIGSQAQQTTIRAIEKKEADMMGKKKGNFGWLLWVGIGLVAVYIIGKLIGWF